MRVNKELLNYVSNESEKKIITARLTYTSNRAAAEAIDVPRRTVDRTVNRVTERAALGGAALNGAKILVLDIETAPMVGYLWSMWQNGTHLGAIESQTYILSWAAKWVGQEEVHADALYYNPDYTAGTEDDTRMLEGLWKLIDEADFVVGHNSDQFDLKWIRGRFLLAGMKPPAPTRPIDTLKIVKRNFKFNSNKLENILQLMYGEGKMDSGGMDTWIKCMKGDPEAWELMIKYNKVDVVQTERLYLDIRAWDHLHPSAAMHVHGDYNCTACGSWEVEPVFNKHVSTNSGKYQLYRCQCGHQMRGRENLIDTETRRSTLLNAK